jgi:predicted RNA-binding protein with TRAM domain
MDFLLSGKPFIVSCPSFLENLPVVSGLEYGNLPSRKPPVKRGERYRVRIEGLGKGGDGIARIKGFVIFVPNTEVGEEVLIEIKSVKERFAFGEVVG